MKIEINNITELALTSIIITGTIAAIPMILKLMIMFISI